MFKILTSTIRKKDNNIKFEKNFSAKMGLKRICLVLNCTQNKKSENKCKVKNIIMKRKEPAIVVFGIFEWYRKKLNILVIPVYLFGLNVALA